jgi:hypothetical protein
MRYARVFALLACAFTLPPGSAVATAAVAATGPLAAEGGLVRPRRPVPDDPLDGLPSEDPGRPGKTGNRAAASCKIDAAPANPRAVGDLRATLAFVQRGPKAWPCPARSPAGTVGLRITIDSAGKITGVEAALGDPATAAGIAKKLTGKTIAPRTEGGTTGTVLLSFAAAKAR